MLDPWRTRGGELIVGNEDMAETLNKFFVSVFTVEDTNSLPNINDRGLVAGEVLNT